MIIDLPWPIAKLSPNKRMHWAALYRAKKAYATSCLWSMKAQGIKPIKADRVHVTIEFLQPDKRHRDMDNCVASFKAGQDAVVNAIGIDDSKWTVTYLPFSRYQQNGLVQLTIKEMG
jgi:Holliday junction resolvase RusA-like endonuclease